MRTVEADPASCRRSRLLIVVAAVLVALLGTAAGAQAHTGLSSSVPAADATLTAPVDAVELRFSGSVGLRDMTVTGPDGATAATGPPSASGGSVSVPVSLVEAGAYTVEYAVTAIDGHSLTGSLSFTYAPPSTAAPTTASPAPAAPTTSTPASAEPTQVASRGEAQDPDGLPSWLVPGLIAVAAVVVAATLVTRRRARSRE